MAEPTYSKAVLIGYTEPRGIEHGEPRVIEIDHGDAEATIAKQVCSAAGIDRTTVDQLHTIVLPDRPVAIVIARTDDILSTYERTIDPELAQLLRYDHK